MTVHDPQQTNNGAFGGVNYPNAKKLLRPRSLGGPSLLLVLILVLAAAALGAFVVYKAADTVYFSEIRKTETIQKNFSRAVDYDFPSLKGYISWESASNVYESVASDNTLVNLSSNEPDSTTFDVFKVPSDVTLEEGKAALKKGIGSMDLVNASKILNGGWRLTMDLSNYQDLRCRYVDFNSASIEEAISKAIETQGFNGEDCEMIKEGIDESGNTYKTGTVDIDGDTYFWRVSALKFNDAYSIKGMPETAIYVGVRMTN